jgi:molybdopterin molybdotransferase
MVSVTEASAIINQNLWKPGIEEIDVLDSLDRVLAVDVLADRDFPPYHRATMDGITIAFESFSKGQVKFQIEGIQAAGMPRKKLSSPACCLEIMTGAILPEGCDTVVRYEDLKIIDGLAEIVLNTIRKGDSIHRQGSDAKANATVLCAGTMISSAEIPLLASVGKARVKVFLLPKTALISTGNELVGINAKPEQHQIRRSNVYAIAAGLKKYKVEPTLFHLQDDEELIRKGLSEILGTHNLIILSGGVSKGKFDLIPSMLEAGGIKKHFHQIKQRPGKPMWFGTGNGKTVFALPGNPVSTFLCYYKYIEPWLLKSLGIGGTLTQAILDSDVSFDLPLTYFLQVKVRNDEGVLRATPIPGGGSGDFVNLKEVDGFLELPEEVKIFKKGEAYGYISFRK